MGAVESRAKYRNENRFQYRDATGAIVVPKGVVDETAYLNYVNLHEEMMGDPYASYQTSDPELKLNLLGNVAYIKKKIVHLHNFERVKILKHVERLHRMKAKVSVYKKRAFHGDKSRATAGDIVEISGESLLSQRHAELIEMFGRFFTLPEVHKVCTMEWGFDVSTTTISIFRTANIEKIKERQEEYRRDYSDVRLGIKRSRLDELSYLYTSRKDLYRMTKHRDDSKEMRAILEQIRKEIEGDKLSIDGDISVKHEHRIQLQVANELLAGMSIKSLIMARSAAKLGVNPLVLQHRLMSGYYAKLNGFLPANKDINTDQIIYPSQMIYDFDELAEKNRLVEAEEARIVEDSTPTERSMEDIRAEIMRKLAAGRTMNNAAMSSIDSKKGE